MANKRDLKDMGEYAEPIMDFAEKLVDARLKFHSSLDKAWKTKIDDQISLLNKSFYNAMDLFNKMGVEVGRTHGISKGLIDEIAKLQNQQEEISQSIKSAGTFNLENVKKYGSLIALLIVVSFCVWAFTYYRDQIFTWQFWFEQIKGLFGVALLLVIGLIWKIASKSLKK